FITVDGDKEQILHHLGETKFFCHRARHDAIDAATSKITADMAIMTERLGYHIVLQVHPKFGDLHRKLREIREKIVVSRQERTNRDKIYAAISATDFKSLISDYNDLLASEPMMRSMAQAERATIVRRETRENMHIAIEIVGGIIALFLIAMHFGWV